nr:unnamed protein product [Callosobruchus chinensis]
MYKLYKEETQNSYRRIFLTEFSLKTKLPKKDTCHSDCESDHSDHNTDTEQSDDDEEEALSFGETCLGRDNETVWRMHPLQKRKSLKRKRKNIVIHLPGPKGEAKNANTIEDSWKLFFPDETIQYIVSCTNIYIDAMQPNSNARGIVRRLILKK